jgi:hypothetical protein
LVAETIDHLRWGNIAFNTTNSLGYGETSTVELLLSPDMTEDELIKEIEPVGDKLGYRINISNVMQARLTGEDFSINSTTSESQATTPHGMTTWKWDIRPKRLGQIPLHLTIDVVVTVNGTEHSHTIRTFDKEIMVNVVWPHSATYFVQDNWGWVLATLGTVGTTFCGLKIWKRKKKKKNK